MDYKRLTGLILVAGASLMGSACSKTNLTVPTLHATTLVDRQSDDTHPLYFVNNVEVKNLKQISPNDIESINVLKPSTANDLVSIYGVQAKNGVIFVKTKTRK